MRSFFPHAIKIKHIEEVHESQDQQDHAELGGNVLYTLHQRLGFSAILQVQQDETDVNEIKANHQQVVYRVSHLFLIFEGIQEKDTPVIVQRACHPDGHGDADDRVGNVDVNGGCHGCPFIGGLKNCAITVGGGLVDDRDRQQVIPDLEVPSSEELPGVEDKQRHHQAHSPEDGDKRTH